MKNWSHHRSSSALGLLIVSVALTSATDTFALGVTPELPRVQAASAAHSEGIVINVNAGDDLQQALREANPGDTIALEAGASFVGPFFLPRKSAADNIVLKPEGKRWITIRSTNTDSSLPAPGIRVSPANASSMANLSSSSGAVVTTESGANHYRFVGIRFSPTESPYERPIKELVLLDGSGMFRRPMEKADLPRQFIFERCYFQGHAILGTRRGIVINAGHVTVIDSYFSDFKIRGEDSQAIVGWEGPGPFLIQNNYLEAAGENVMFGGADPASESLVPSDITIKGNHFARPKSWRWNGNWTIKNILELKNARRILITGNVFEYNWPNAQNGFAILFTVRNQEGTAPWSVVEDVTFSNNIVRHVGSGINILGYDDHHPSQQTSRILIRNNLFIDIGGKWGEGNLLQLLDGTSDVTFELNTVFNTGNILIAEGRPQRRFTFRRNIVQHGGYGIVGRGKAPGNSALAFYLPGYDMSDNMIVGGSRRLYPSGNAFPSALSDVDFIDFKRGDFRLSKPSRQLIGVDFHTLCAALSTIDRPTICNSLAMP